MNLGQLGPGARETEVVPVLLEDAYRFLGHLHELLRAVLEVGPRVDAQRSTRDERVGAHAPIADGFCGLDRLGQNLLGACE